MIYILSWTTEKGKKGTFQAAAFKVEENSRTFRGKMKLKDFLRTFPKILRTVRSLKAILVSRHSAQVHYINVNTLFFKVHVPEFWYSASAWLLSPLGLKVGTAWTLYALVFWKNIHSIFLDLYFQAFLEVWKTWLNEMNKINSFKD